MGGEFSQGPWWLQGISDTKISRRKHKTELLWLVWELLALRDPWASASRRS